MENLVDARGKACPQPVICTKKALEKLSENNCIITIVDNEIAKDNIVRLAKNLDYPVEVEQKETEYHIKITKVSDFETRVDPRNKQVVFLPCDKIGRGDDKLGEVLMKSFLYTLANGESVPAAVILMNSGVKLGVEGSEVLEHLIHLEKRGTEIIFCGTCLDYYDLKDKLCLGTISNMYTILEYLSSAEKVLSF